MDHRRGRDHRPQGRHGDEAQRVRGGLHRLEHVVLRNRDEAHSQEASTGDRVHHHGNDCGGRGGGCVDIGNASRSPDAENNPRSKDERDGQGGGTDAGGGDLAKYPVRRARAEPARRVPAHAPAGASGGNGTIREDRDRAALDLERPLRACEAEAAGRIWMDPPSWMYLPHLGCGGGATPWLAPRPEEGHAEEGWLHTGSGTTPSGAAAAVIKGRSEAPGDGACGRPRGSGEIRGREKAPGTANVRRRAGSAAAAANAEAAKSREAAMARFFADLDERAAAKKRRADDPHKDPGRTPSQRMEALRRRIATRAEAGSRGASSGIGDTNGNSAGTCQRRPPFLRDAPAAAAADVARRTDSARQAVAEGAAQAAAARSSIEDAKIHQTLHVEDSGGTVAKSEGRPSPAAAAAAADVAWHAAEAHPSAP